ncbi:MAG: hypothetical protein ACR2RA_05570 [Geminicoccaceae bacterium]
MAKNSSIGPSSRTPKWFARRQVYLRAGQDSQYVELSPMLQIGVALGFGALALWLIGASYGAVNSYLGKNRESALLAKLGSTEQALEDAERTRDATVADAARIADLEAELVKARAAAADAAENEETLALTTELDQTRAQIEELHLRLSESKADHAALQARFEAEELTTSDDDAKTAEEAASLHAQLEEAFDEIATLQTERDAATAKLAAAEKEEAARDEATERNTALLKAATAEIERLQETVAAAETEAEDDAREHKATLASLEAERDELARKIDDLGAELETARTAMADAERSEADAEIAAVDAAFDAEIQAQSITAGLKEADLLAQLEDLRFELAAVSVKDEAVDDPAEENGSEIGLRERVAIAEAELERLLLAGLKADDEPAAAPRPEAAAEDPAETERLRQELLAAQADIIKLNADVRAAKQRLAEKPVNDGGQVSKPDNSAKLEQQLASTRSRVQQLNRALANAKLREVAIDLALINVVPAPSPPAPR